MTTECTLKVGAAKYIITPPLDQARRVGPKGLATDVIGELCARATVFDDGVNKAAIVLLDISEFFPNITKGVRELASKWTDIPAQNIMVCATHTHSSAKVIDYDDPFDTGGVMVEYEKLSDETQAYLDMLYRYAASAVFLADTRRRPARGKIGEVSVPGIGKPRLRLKSGEVISFTHARASMDEFHAEDVEAVSPYDDALRILVFEDMAGKPICGMGNFGCHNALAMGGMTLNSDYFGWTAERVEREIGEDFVFSLMAGPEGNVHPAAFFQHDVSVEVAESFVPVAGKMLYDATKEIWNSLEPFQTDIVSSAIKEVYFPVQQPTPLRAKTYLHGRRVTGGRQDEKGVYSELQLIRVGDFAVLGLCGEVFQEIALNLRNASPFKHTWVDSLCNDELSYLMPAHEHRRDNESGKMNVQKEFAISDGTAEALIYDAFGELFEQVAGARA